MVYALSCTGKKGNPKKGSEHWGRCDESKRLPVEKLAERAEISVRTFARIMSRITWANVKLEDIDKFFKGCGINPFRMHEHRDYIQKAMTRNKTKRWPHLNAQQWQTFLKLGKKWQAAKERKGAKAQA